MEIGVTVLREEEGGQAVLIRGYVLVVTPPHVVTHPCKQNKYSVVMETAELYSIWGGLSCQWVGSHLTTSCLFTTAAWLA